MFQSGEEVEINFDVEADEQLDPDIPVEIVVRWNSPDEIDLHALFFDDNGHYMQVC